MTPADRVTALVALLVFVALTVGTAPFVAGAFPSADMSEPLGGELVAGDIVAAIQLYLVLCVSALVPAFLWYAWLRPFGGPLAVIGLPGQAPRGSFPRGAFGGCLLILLTCAVLAGAGWYRLTLVGPDATVVAVLLGLAVAALYEELLFRGFGFWLMDRAVGPWFAVVGSSVLFALAHADNSGAHWLGMANTAFAGVLLALLRLKSGHLWGAWGVHLGWNAALGLLFGARTSGFAFAGRLLEADVTAAGARHVVLAGGAYGPEGSAVLTPLLLVWITWLVRRKRTGGLVVGSEHPAQ